MTIKEMLCERERDTLSPYAFLSENTAGRAHAISPDCYRTEFQRDRDRIIHAKAFRRLMHKTQVFLSPVDEHYRTRLTHTLEVTQIARTLARSMRLNEDLTEAIALGHDLGHTPFGHAGERVLQACFDPHFTHCKQSLRVAEVIERLNLTKEVLDGIVNHAGKNQACTREGILVKYADRIAYINHDIDDAVRAGVMQEEDIPRHLRELLGYTHGQRIETMVKAIIQESADRPDIRMQPEIEEAMMALRDFLFSAVYTNPAAKGEEVRAEAMLKALYEYFCENVDLLPTEYKCIALEEGVKRGVADYLAGMTDRYAIGVYKKYFIPEAWRSG
ncbi:MAG: deoxyguanosinetriphosphate triphosphohydrolase [Clostridiales bacterium]|nr:deoxyguanosinetriphosphate triphosphohydrolase [Clostridiales bacterium]